MIPPVEKFIDGGHPVKFIFRIIILALIVIALVNGGWILKSYLTLNNAARQGVQVAVVNEESLAAVSEVKSVVKEHAGDIFLFDDDIEVNYAPIIGGQTEVTVSGDIKLPASFHPLPEYIELSASAAMRQEK